MIEACAKPVIAAPPPATLGTAELRAALGPRLGECYRPLIGFEYEVLLFDAASLRQLPYHGPRGAGAVLRRAAGLWDGELLPGEPPHKCALADGAQLSLEPGGQLEYSSAPVATFGEILAQLDRFAALLRRLERELGLRAFAGGVSPLHGIDDVGLVVPTERYRLMDAWFPRVGGLGRVMMRQTASVQVTLDFPDEDQGAELLRAAFALAPLAAAIFANSPYYGRQRAGHLCYRGAVWRDTDPSRCGAVPGCGQPGFDFEHYIAHVLRAPLLFVASAGGALRGAGGATFDRFNREGLHGRYPTIADFNRHNSTIFTDARLKRTVELRSIDAQRPRDVPAVIALVAGLLLDRRARRFTSSTLGALGLAEDAARAAELGRLGVGGTVCGRPTHQLALALVERARRGVVDGLADGARALPWLDRLAARLRQRLTPADLVLRRFGDDPAGWVAAGLDGAGGDGRD